MANTVISAKYPPHIDVTRTPLAYGDRAIPRLNRELNDLENLLKRQRAVRSLCDHLHDAEHIAEAVRCGVVQSLQGLLTDEDITIREKTLECIHTIAQHAIGREALLRLEAVHPVSKLWNDTEDIVRLNAHKATGILSENVTGAEGIVSSKLVPLLVQKLKEEIGPIQILVLDTLHNCMGIDTGDALSSNAMEAFTQLLADANDEIKCRAARNIMDLSVTLDGKNKAVEVNCLSMLVNLLKSSTDTQVQANAAGAVMIIAITTQGKKAALEAEALPALVALVDSPCSETRANSLKALTCLSESPHGRHELQQHMEKIAKLTEDRVPAVAKCAQIAVNTISWKP